ncbi:hypothetical protein ACF1DY_26665 [Streptomyces albus]
MGDRLGEDHEGDNQVSGTVHGAVVQVGTVHGDIHLAAGSPTAPQVPGPGHPADDAAPWQLPSVPPLTDRAAAQLPALGDERAGALAVLNLADSHLDACAPATGGTAVHGRDDSTVVTPADSRDAVRALEHAQAAHRVLAGKGDVYNAARAAIAAGRACLVLGRMGEAEEQLSGALGVLRGMNADFEAARALGALAALAERQGRARLAAEHGRAALRLHEGLSGTESAQARQVRALLARLPGESGDRAAPGGHAPASEGHVPTSDGHDAAPEEQ